MEAIGDSGRVLARAADLRTYALAHETWLSPLALIGMGFECVSHRRTIQHQGNDIGSLELQQFLPLSIWLRMVIRQFSIGSECRDESMDSILFCIV